MARTHIKAVAQQKALDSTAAYQEIDSSNINNSGLEQVDYNVNTASNVMDPPVHEKRYWHIIKGHGVGGEHISEYPDIDPNSGYSQFGAEVSAAGHKLGNLSVIFDYLNAAGSSIKYTKLEYTKVFSGEDDQFVNLFNRHLSEENYYHSPIKYTMEIYWGDYIKYSSDQGNLPPEQFNIQSIKDLSGEKNILLKDFNQNPGAYVVGSDTMNQGWLKINLDTKKIISLPSLLGASSTSDAVHTWTIETDDFATTVTAPTPQETTEEVSGTKISQLSSITTVQDSDLFVISRDDVSQGEGDISYDNSYNLEYNVIYQNILNELKSEFSLKLNLSTVIAWTKGEGTAYIQGQSGFTGNTLPEGTWLLLYFPWLSYDGGGEDDNAWYHGTPIIRQEVAGFDIRSWMVSEGNATHFGNYHSGSTSPRSNYTGHGIGLKVS